MENLSPPEASASQCTICGSAESAPSYAGPLYRRCRACGHEMRTSEPEDLFIVNDLLSAKEAKTPGALDRFKRGLLRRIAKSHHTLIDIGSASGKFLFLNRDLFEEVIGIEVTPQCIEFARKELGLRIESELPPLTKPLSVATFWHTLEHIETRAAENIIAKLREISRDDTRILVSVPNGDSLLYRLFGERFTYYDPESHRHTFTLRSLEKLFGRAGFRIEKNRPSLVYELFGAIQTLLNCLNPIHNFLYYRKKRGRSFEMSAEMTTAEQRKRELRDTVTAALLLPLAALLALVGIAAPGYATVLNVTFEPERDV